MLYQLIISFILSQVFVLVATSAKLIIVTKREDKRVEVRKTDEGELLKEVIVKIGLERIDMQEVVTVKALLDSKVTGLVMYSEFAKKQ